MSFIGNQKHRLFQSEKRYRFIEKRATHRYIDDFALPVLNGHNLHYRNKYPPLGVEDWLFESFKSFKSLKLHKVISKDENASRKSKDEKCSTHLFLDRKKIQELLLWFRNGLGMV